ncbi:MAG TPA: hypothetical protein VGQ29_16200 [Gemmatimonadales bacterium]|nr:hypothetical protein [Gemmatimonadales bacterium]
MNKIAVTFAIGLALAWSCTSDPTRSPSPPSASLQEVMPAASGGPVILSADGQTAAYTRIQGVLKSAPETPDCSHPAFGPHITQAVDRALRKYVFVFNIHVTPDNDRCSAFDRQRLEIKTQGNSSTPDYLKGFLGDTVTFRWKFRLPEGFQPSTSFTHIHQLKAYDGDAGAPIITLTPRKGNPNSLQLIHVDSRGVTRHLASTPLDSFVGVWVEAYERVTYGATGRYSIVINRLSDGATLFAYSTAPLDLWREGTTVVRPKWGLYRSLNHPEHLRDEHVLFDRFCLAKGADDCVSEEVLPDFSLKATPRSPAVAPGDVASYHVAVTPLRGFADAVSVSVMGLPEGASVTFAPASLTVSTSTSTPPGVYPLVVSGISGVLSHVSVVPLSVRR